MYWTVPITAPAVESGVAGDGEGMVCVNAAAKTEGDVSLPLPDATVAPSGLARPKSRSLAADLVSITLPGFKSRCTTPARCAFSGASAISMAMVTTGWSERPLSQPLGQRLPLQEPHYKVVNGAFVAHIVERADVGMLKL